MTSTSASSCRSIPVPALGALGNRVVPTLARLPLEIRDPRERLRVIAKSTQALKVSKQIGAIELFEDVSNWMRFRMSARRERHRRPETD